MKEVVESISLTDHLQLLIGELQVLRNATAGDTSAIDARIEQLYEQLDSAQEAEFDESLARYRQVYDALSEARKKAAKAIEGLADVAEVIEKVADFIAGLAILLSLS